ncbi:MAG TPA: hypothetical protein VFJ19_09655 [Nocardioidaceae bacterium]|nr:hypothetical protein [Nocardioidaceae bacterium]
MPTTDQDARALTYLVKRLREETYGANRWDETGIHAVIAKLVGRNLPSVVEQVTRHASDAEAKTPGAINRPFVPDAPKAGPNYPPKRGEDCPRHPGQWKDACRGCAADKLAGEQAPAEPANPRCPSPIARQHLNQARAQLASLVLCGHGVDRSKGKCNDCATETSNETSQEATK